MSKSYLIPKAICVFNEFWSKPLVNAGGYKDVVYTKRLRYADDPRLYLNLCEKKEQNGEKKPIFFYIHGGGYVSGRPENREGCVSRFAEAGYLTASVFYGYAPKYKHPAPVYNIYDALAYLVKNKEKYNIDIDNIIVGGESAGAHFAALLGAISSSHELKAHYEDLNPLSKDLKFKGLFLNCGIFSMKDAAESKFPFIKAYLSAYYGKNCKDMLSDPDERYVSPINFLNRDYPPCYVITAEHDGLRFGGFRFYDSLKHIGVQSEHYHAKGFLAIHAFAVGQKLKTSKVAVKNALLFFDGFISNKAQI